ncbi:type 4a pilus biogenesis protein PilO [Geothrix sp. PMB-07]|uniref:type 4a pilus biogenesis protein PilO n=1 Tax=Geothrix sp. PMB-07 TaxID=3068640 RepID=UPI0027410A9A|nr:type 4a pilus biogenesis protein PilO [Geothrix sp. PMB-07]WLT33146.1 type 4a pilus biogenesis protein PilO [Geothrix sp. PMB-07]
MNPQLQKQIGVGALIGIVLAGLVYFLLGGKRSDLEAVNADVKVLQADVDKGKLLKASYEKLREEVARQDKRIEELIKIMPSDADYGEIPYRIKKLADDAGIDQVSFSLKPERKDTYYTEKPVEFEFRVGYHSFGQFASLLSGYDKIINISNIEFSRKTDTRSLYPATVKCLISAFVYNPEPPPAEAVNKPAAPAPKAGSRED